jgi:hypothetical protein
MTSCLTFAFIYFISNSLQGFPLYLFVTFLFDSIFLYFVFGPSSVISRFYSVNNINFYLLPLTSILIAVFFIIVLLLNRFWLLLLNLIRNFLFNLYNLKVSLIVIFFFSLLSIYSSLTLSSTLHQLEFFFFYLSNSSGWVPFRKF